jgi:hypothetical protein
LDRHFSAILAQFGSRTAPPEVIMRRSLGFGLLALVVLFSASGCDRGNIAMPETGINDMGPLPDGGMAFQDTGIGFSQLSILRVVPDHGPFSGGNTAVLRGAGFTAAAQVTFGTHNVQPADHTLIDARRLQVVVPAGAVGTVDVSIRVGTDTFTLPMGYTYDALSVDPTRGSVAGGTFVNIVGSGTSFATGDTVTFGRTPCTQVMVVSPTRITCRTPSLSAGTVDVTVTPAAGGAPTTAFQAYTYYDTADPFAGGLGGGHANGMINVTAIDAVSGNPVEGAFVIVGEDLTTQYQGRTNAMGQISFSGPDLVGQHNVHIEKHCYERTSFIAADAQDVTAFLVQSGLPSCGMGPPPPPGRGRNGSYVEGDLVWYTDSSSSWRNVPPPRGTTTCPTASTLDMCTTMGCQWNNTSCSTPWVRVAYVYATQEDIGVPNPDPSLGAGTIQRVLETPIMDGLGYPYRIFVAPRGQAVFALAGLENTMTHVFIPYVMGVARNVLVGPGETASGVNIHMDIPLDHALSTQLGMLPAQVNGEPDRYYLQGYMDLGGEGVIVRNVNGTDFDSIRRRDTSRPFTFEAEPALEGTLADGRFRIIAGYTAAYDGFPYTYVVMNGVTAVDSMVQLPDFLGVPDAMAPANNERLPNDRIIRWQEVGSGPHADFHLILINGGDGHPAWRLFVRGDQFTAPIPDLSSIPMVEDIATGQLDWEIYSITVPGFDYDTMTYNYLNQRYWSAYSFNFFTAQL